MVKQLKRLICLLALPGDTGARISWFIVLGFFLTCSYLTLKTRNYPVPGTLKFVPEKDLNQWLLESVNVCPDLVRPDVSPNNGEDKSRPTITEKLYDTWHVVNGTNIEVYVFSVFYDARIGVLRVLAVGRRIPEGQKLACQLWYDEFTYPLVTRATLKKNGRGHRIGGVHYDQYYLSCDAVPIDTMPTHVSVATADCDETRNFIPIILPSRTNVHDFGICVPVSYWHIDANRLIEWVEANQIFGVGEFNVYHVNMDEETMKVLRYYESKGIMRLTHLPSAPTYQHDFNGVSIGSPISLNDCMYRNMYRYKWIMVVDFDNLIIPHLSDTYKEMMHQLEEDRKNEPIAVSYSVRNMYHWIGCGFESKGTFWNGSYYYRYRHRLPANEFKFSAESFVDPLHCESIFNHYCYISLPLPAGTPRTVDLPAKIVATHHYRKFSADRNETICADVAKNGIQDNSMLRFEDELKQKCLQAEQAIRK